MVDITIKHLQDNHCNLSEHHTRERHVGRCKGYPGRARKILSNERLTTRGLVVQFISASLRSRLTSFYFITCPNYSCCFFWSDFQLLAFRIFLRVNRKNPKCFLYFLLLAEACVFVLRKNLMRHLLLLRAL